MKSNISHWKRKGKKASPKAELLDELKLINHKIIMRIKSRNVPYDLLFSEGKSYAVYLIEERILSYDISWPQRRDIIDTFELYVGPILDHMNENHWLAERGRKANGR